MNLRSNIVIIDLHDYDRIKNELKDLRLSLQVSETKIKLMNELVVSNFVEKYSISLFKIKVVNGIMQSEYSYVTEYFNELSKRYYIDELELIRLLEIEIEKSKEKLKEKENE